MKKRVGLISFHKSINYGVYLQAYALQTFLEQYGNEAEIIDYNKFTENKKQKKSILYRLLHFKETLNIMSMLLFLHQKGAKEKEEKFASFSEKFFHLSKPMNSFNEIASEQYRYDKVVCGSDQIWNPEYTQANPVYFLEFAPSEKRIAYAPSFGVSKINETFCDLSDKYRNYLKNFSAISVREKTGQKIIQEISDLFADVVVDPTLLVTPEHWEQISKKVEMPYGKYVVFYILGKNSQYRKLAKIITKKYKYNVICIPTNPLWNNLSCVEKCYAGVDEFLYLIKNAEYVITDSFHGTAFSVIFHKNFSAILRNDTNHSLCSRIEDFLGTINLSDNCVSVSDIHNIDVNEITDYNDSDRILNTWIEESKEYLLKAVSQGEKHE